jgi:hypothetical protein
MLQQRVVLKARAFRFVVCVFQISFTIDYYPLRHCAKQTVTCLFYECAVSTPAVTFARFHKSGMLVLMLFWGLTLSFLGKVVLGLAVIMVHIKITHEKRIDGIVLMEMRREQLLTLLAIGLMTVGYFLELAHFGFI